MRYLKKKGQEGNLYRLLCSARYSFKIARDDDQPFALAMNLICCADQVGNLGSLSSLRGRCADHLQEEDLSSDYSPPAPPLFIPAMMGPEAPSGLDPPIPSESSASLPLASSSPSSSIYHSTVSSNPLLFPSSSSFSSSSALIDPPSYADAVFRPVEPQNGRNSTSRSSMASSRSGRASTSDYLEITVTDPRKENDYGTSLVPGGSVYFTYHITTRVRVTAAAFSVRHRFRDFVTLADRLAESYRGCFIPLRPDKSVVESQVMQKQEFVEHRREALEKYLQRLAAHPVVGRSEELRVFLQEQGKLPLMPTTDVALRMLDGAVRLPRQLFGDRAYGSSAPQEVVQPAKGGRDLLRMFKELKQSVSNDWGGTKPLVVEEDKEFLERKERTQELTLQLNATSEQAYNAGVCVFSEFCVFHSGFMCVLHAEELVKAQHDIGETMGELGLALIELIKLENDEAVHVSQRVGAADTKIVATAAVKASRFYRELNSQTIKHLETVHEYMGLMLSIRNAFSERSDALLTLQTLLSDLASLRARTERLEAASARVFGRDESRIQRLEEIKKTIIVTEDAKECASREYEKIKAQKGQFGGRPMHKATTLPGAVARGGLAARKSERGSLAEALW
ncbi:Sorting nexin 2B [Platanthera guangdongensis]|uniref:Sorting nexin 2B n=1 Tax=Platanthera guangdongensis TaxID=2320717 RepID=A0ABR2MB62_9ASPA